MPDNAVRKIGHRYQVGHPFYPAKGPRKATIRDQRKAQARALSKMIADYCSAVDRGEPVDPNAFTRLIGLQMRLEREL